MTSLFQPLSSQVAIVDSEGKPTAQFARLLQKLGLAAELKLNADGTIGIADDSITEAMIQDDAVTLPKIEDISDDRVLGNNNGSAASPEELTASEVLDMIGATHGDILYRDSDDWQVLAPGNDGDVLTTHGSSADPTWETPSAGGGGAWTLINSGGTTFTTASTVDIPLASGYVAHQIIFYATFSTDAGDLNAQVTTDNFSTVKSGVSDYNYNSWRGNTSGNSNTTSNGTTLIKMITNKGSAAGDDATGEFTVWFADDSAKLTALTKRITYGIGGGASPGIEVGDGRYLTAATVNGIRLAPSTGTMTGSYRIYGLTG